MAKTKAITLRIPVDLHEALLNLSDKTGMTINSLINMSLLMEYSLINIDYLE